MEGTVYHTVSVADFPLPMGELGSGSHILELSTHDILPSGLYTIVIEGINEEELIRRVVVLP